MSLHHEHLGLGYVSGKAGGRGVMILYITGDVIGGGGGGGVTWGGGEDNTWKAFRNSYGGRGGGGGGRLFLGGHYCV